MQQLNLGLQWISAAAYTLLGFVAVADWVRHRDRARGYLAVALGLLGVIVLLGQVQQLMGKSYPRGLTYLSSVSLTASGYGLVLLRHHIIPYRRRVLIAITAGAIAVTAWALTLPPTSSDPKAKISAYVLLAAVIYLGYWCGMVGEPAFRLWRTSRERPAVQRARLRALALSCLLIVAVFVLLIAVVGALYGSGQATTGSAVNPLVSFAFELLFLAAVPALYVSFRPPAWLRRSWRSREEESFRGAIHDLLLFSPDRTELASRAVEWASRLVGAEGAVITEAGDRILAASEIDPELLPAILSAPQTNGAGPAKLGRDLRAVKVPMPTQRGIGALTVVSGSFTPIFGGEEVDRLREYATSVTVALDRVDLFEKVQQANTELEARVRERTRQLELTNGELSAINKELEAFSYSVSHDLRAPLRGISGFSRILLEEHSAELDDEARGFLTDIDANAREMGNLIEDLLELSRLGRQRLAMKSVDPAAVAGKALDQLAGDLHDRSIEIEVREMPTCEADPVLLQLVYLNLLSNAVKFTRDREPAHVVAGAVERSDPTVYFVQDNGAGFDMTYKDQLFNVFQRLHPRSEYEGTGVGLAIVQRVVARHGGRTWAEGAPGSGATFYFTLAGGNPDGID